MKKLIALLASSLFLAGAVWAGEYAEISVQDLDAAIKAGKVTVIDVNGSDSYANRGHVPGAIDFVANKEKLASLLPADKSQLIVAYCGGPDCGAYAKAANAAAELGYTNVKHLKAGIAGWLEASMPVEKSAQKPGCSACQKCEKKDDDGMN